MSSEFSQRKLQMIHEMKTQFGLFLPIVLILLRHITDQHMLMLACYYIKVSLVSMPTLSGTSVSVSHQSGT